jgi:hypothetical protein
MLLRKVITGLFFGVVATAGLFCCMRVFHLSLFASGAIVLPVGILFVWLVTRIIPSKTYSLGRVRD